MAKCDHCDKEFESKKDLQAHKLEEHEDELNSHEKEDAKKARREQEEKEEQIKERRKRYLYQGVGGVILLAVVAVVGAQLIPSGSAAEFDLEDEPMLGDENASVTIVEFGDFQCPACAGFNNGPIQQLKSEYVETGKVKMYWKDYPLVNIHPWSQPAAETMECVYKEDNEAFWNVKERLFRNQGVLGITTAEDQIIEWASKEGINKTSIRTCLESEDPGNKVDADKREGKNSGVTGTPSIYVNGKKLDGFGYQTIKNAVENELDN